MDLHPLHRRLQHTFLLLDCTSHLLHVFGLWSQHTVALRVLFLKRTAGDDILECAGWILYINVWLLHTHTVVGVHAHTHTQKLCSSGGEAGAAVYGAEVTTFTHRCKVQQSWERSHVDKRAVCVCPVVCLSVVAVTFSLPLTSLSRLAGSQLPYRGTESDRAELRDAAMRL